MGLFGEKKRQRPAQPDGEAGFGKTWEFNEKTWRWEAVPQDDRRGK